jgi:hypothetical protein
MRRAFNTVIDLTLAVGIVQLAHSHDGLQTITLSLGPVVNYCNAARNASP